MRGREMARIGLGIVLSGMIAALGFLLFAQQPPPSEGGYGGVGQPAPCVCAAPSTPPAPNWIKITQVRLLPQKKIRIEWAPVPTGGSGSLTHTLQDPNGNTFTCSHPFADFPRYALFRGLLYSGSCSIPVPYHVTQWQLVAYLPENQTSFEDPFDFPYNTPIFYAVQAQTVRHISCFGHQSFCSGDKRVIYSLWSPFTFCYLVIDKVFVSDHSSVDSRLDFRKNPVTFRNYRFGYSTYRGGLFVGFADDPSRIARIYLKFPFPSPPFEPDDQIWDASLLLFYTQPHESSVDIPSDPTQPHPVALKVYVASSNDWGQRSIHWSNKPSISDPAFLLFEGSAFPGSWVEIHDGKNPENSSETRRFKDIVVNNGTVTYVLTMPDDSPNYCLVPDPAEKVTMRKRWKYFAKREFKERLAPFVLRATGKQVLAEQVCTQH